MMTACATMTRQRGFVFPDDLYTQVENITTTRQLIDAFGHPAAQTVHGPVVWIYYGARENHRGPLPLTWDERTVMLAWVDGARVTEIQILRDDDLPAVRVARGETPIPAAIELSAIQELFNNIGRFTPAGLGQ